MAENIGAEHGGAPGSRGRTTIADVVVEKIAGMAARDVLGVHALGSGFARSMGSMRERMPGAGSGKSVTRGVSVEVGAQPRPEDGVIVDDHHGHGPVAAGGFGHVVSLGMSMVSWISVPVSRAFTAA